MGTNGFLTNPGIGFWHDVYGQTDPTDGIELTPDAYWHIANKYLHTVQAFIDLTFPEGVTIFDLALKMAGMTDQQARQHYIVSGELAAAQGVGFDGDTLERILYIFAEYTGGCHDCHAPDVSAMQCFRGSVLFAYLCRAIAVSLDGDLVYSDYMTKHYDRSLPTLSLQIVRGQDPGPVKALMPINYQLHWLLVIGLGLDDTAVHD